MQPVSIYKNKFILQILIVLSLIFYPNFISQTHAATTGAIAPTLAVTAAESPWLDNDWTTPTNIYSDNAATANVTAATFDSGDQTYVLKATGFDFSSIPDGATIDGVIMRANTWYRSGQGSGALDLCQILSDTKAKVGTNNCSTQEALTTTNTTIITKGSSSDKWGNALTTAWVKDPDFGIALGIKATAANADVDIDYVTLEIHYTFNATTTLADGTNPSNQTLGPGSSITDLDSFTLSTNAGTDSVTAATVTLASGTNAGLSEVRVTSDDGATTYFTATTNPGSNVVNFSGGTPIPVTTSSTQFKIRITPKSHSDMPAPNGSTYSVTGTITSLTTTNAQSGTDSASATLTIDNTSPNPVTSSSITGGIEQVTLNWTNPVDSDFSEVVILRRATSSITDTPVEGSSYSAGNTVGSTTVACVTSTTNCTDTTVTGGTSYHYKIFTKDSRGNYDTGTTPTNSPITPTALIISITITSDGVISYGNVNLGESKSTIDLSDTQTISNDSNVPVDLNIKTTAATGGTPWSIGSTIGNNICVHEFSINSGSLWTKFTTADSYQSLTSNLAVSSTQNVDYRLTVPSSSTDYVQKTLTTTIQAVQH